ncbi:Aim19p CYBJADRAFT_3347 [Cyberlindnera jadinii NRRL Y-1542]|uniref:Altered inheritance of mitochondria protein 19, mitochondrial n=1 Tax=Cyberlindnera jadinii (strain ATCC 18201 / CBS 1600 / BCRC 20928 / JCM 3617 / NBRC 0987 / NRRL Y-1542) TaxID=983966 RepID=A0A1E4S8M9_CYBJN|nr:hypothetical protein CYBJADRAFT_3347 [Cyberlindnera jadinii NRRL Y-1542]ODV75823.1 hypothetical protein CYBJADRAFT_3347 [Cyberlindnera jadinii NRRL Y-1542]
MTEEIKATTNDYREQLYASTTTPYPSLLFSGMLFATPLITSQPEAVTRMNADVNRGVLFKTAKRLRVGPTTVSSVLFGSAMALGSWIMFEGDVESGSGFITAWSSLYLIVNGRQMFNGLRYARVWPVVLSSVALGEAVLHGKRFFYGVGQ